MAPLREVIEKNPLWTMLVVAGIAIGAFQTLSSGVKSLDKMICTEAEAEEMIKQQAVPVQRSLYEFQIYQLEKEQKELQWKLKSQVITDYEMQTLNDLNEEIDRLREEKRKLE